MMPAAKTTRKTPTAPAPDRQEIAADVLLLAEQKAERLTEQRFETAQQIERERAERAQRVAVEQATFIAETKHDLSDHASQLKTLNGNIKRSADGLESLKDHMTKRDKIIDERDVEYKVEAKEHWKSKGQAFSKRQMLVGYLSVAAMLLATLVPIVVHAFGG